MKSLFFMTSVALILSSTVSFAKTSVVIFDETPAMTTEPQVVRPSFDVEFTKPELQRAWVEIDVVGDTSATADFCCDKKVIRKTVKGLTYDAQAKTVVFRAENSNDSVICATVENSESVKPTGHCKLVSKIERKDFDDGFHVHKKNFVVVTMVVE